jgi:hypothetical protein
MNNTAAHAEATATHPAGTVLVANGLRWEVLDHTSQPVRRTNPYTRNDEVIGWDAAYVVKCVSAYGYALRVLTAYNITKVAP